MLVIGIAAGGVPDRHGTGQSRRLFKIRQRRTPELSTGLLITLAEPFDVIAITPLPCARRDAGVTLQHFAEQLRSAPAVHEDVMAGVDQVMSVFIDAHQRHAQQRCVEQIETVVQVLSGQMIKC